MYTLGRRGIGGYRVHNRGMYLHVSEFTDFWREALSVLTVTYGHFGRQILSTGDDFLKSGSDI